MISEALAIASGEILEGEARGEGDVGPAPLARRTLRYATASGSFQELKHELVYDLDSRSATASG
jgi:hypothetical protein